MADSEIPYKSREQVGNRYLYRFDNVEDQLKASDAIQEDLGDSYVVALNLAHATPDGLRAVGGKPMTLGLDLQGGVHFLMQVDMVTARGQQLDRYVDDIRASLRDEKISAMKEQIAARDEDKVIQSKAIEAFQLADKKSTEQISALQATIKINKVKYDKMVKSIPKHLASGCEVEPGVRVYGSEIAINKCAALMKAGRE